MKRLISVFFSLIVCYLFYQYISGDQGVKQQDSMKKQIEFQELTNAKLARRNDALVAELENLREGHDAIEEKIRTELQYIKNGEVFYRMVEQ